MASKLFHKLGASRNHKKFAPEPPSVDYNNKVQKQKVVQSSAWNYIQQSVEDEQSSLHHSTNAQASDYLSEEKKHLSKAVQEDNEMAKKHAAFSALELELADEYALPVDAEKESDTAVYCEPVDTLQKACDSPTTEVLKESVSLEETQKDKKTSADKLSLPDVVLETTSSESAFVSTSLTESTMNSTMSGLAGYDQKPRLQSSDSPIYYNDITSFTNSKDANASPPQHTPETDPRNVKGGDEYDCPWDLKNAETEIYELVKEKKAMDVASSKQSANHSMEQAKYKTEANQAKHLSPPASLHMVKTGREVKSNKVKHCQHKSKRNEGETAHIVKQPSCRKQQTGAVLVEGEWRESRAPLVTSHSINSPELESPAQIIAQGPVKKVTNSVKAASNQIYEERGSAEIQAKLRLSDDQWKVPMAQPRTSTRSSSASEASLLYQNCQEVAEDDLNSSAGVYDDPWSSGRIEQDLMEKFAKKSPPIDAKATKVTVTQELRPTYSQQPSSKSAHRKENHHRPIRPTDLQSETAQNARNHNIAAMQSIGTDKLSPRVTASTHLAVPFMAPPVPMTGPGQTHANKPLIVRTQPSQRSSSTSCITADSVRRSFRKEPTSPADVPECQHKKGISVDKSKDLCEQSWFHGAIHRSKAEELLAASSDCSFLIRIGAPPSEDLTLSLKNSSGFIHIKLKKQMDGKLILGQFSHAFSSVADVVEYYSRHKVNIKGAEHTYLVTPVNRKVSLPSTLGVVKTCANGVSHLSSK